MEKLRDAARGMRFPENDRQVVGRLLGPDGSILEGIDQLWSGRKGPAEGRTDIRENICDDPPDRFSKWETTSKHVESHAAAAIRAMGIPQHLILLVSREPCDLGPPSCETTLPKILPPGSSLTVFVAGRGEDPRFYGTYDGTGEGLK